MDVVLDDGNSAGTVPRHPVHHVRLAVVGNRLKGAA
jgi:hypothetical protein